jgi:hypothetical protein
LFEKGEAWTSADSLGHSSNASVQVGRLGLSFPQTAPEAAKADAVSEGIVKLVLPSRL